MFVALLVGEVGLAVFYGEVGFLIGVFLLAVDPLVVSLSFRSCSANALDLFLRPTYTEPISSLILTIKSVKCLWFSASPVDERSLLRASFKLYRYFIDPVIILSITFWVLFILLKFTKLYSYVS